MTRILTATGLRYTYPDGTVAVDGIDVVATAGERIAIVGPNGAGKSTLLLLLGGLLEPTDGTVRYFGDVTDADDVRDRLSVVLQDPEDYLFNSTVRDDLEYGPAQLDVPRDEAEAHIRTLVERLDLENLLEKPPFRLSGGEKRRTAVACGLSTDPDLLLVDEPFSNVDAGHRGALLDLLGEHNESGMATIVATSNTDIVPHLADRVYLLNTDGVLAAQGPTREVMTAVETLQNCGLSPPTVVDLFRAVGEDDLPLTVEEGARRLAERPSRISDGR